MLSTMPDYPLALVPIMEHGGKVHGESEVATWTGDGVRRASFREVAARARKLADAFRASRLEGDWGRAFGTLPPGVDTDSVIAACG
jgi:fatty-acyl-CoA synthase